MRSRITKTVDGAYVWTLRITMRNPVWVADGLDLGNPDHIVDMLQHNYGGTRGDEWAVEVVAAPDPRQIRAEQGGSVPGFEPFFKE